MTGSITEDQFKNFCKNFVEKYEGSNFKELVKSIDENLDSSYNGSITKDFKCIPINFGLIFKNEHHIIFGYNKTYKNVFINCFYTSDCDYFYNIEDIQKVFKI